MHLKCQNPYIHYVTFIDFIVRDVPHIGRFVGQYKTGLEISQWLCAAYSAKLICRSHRKTWQFFCRMAKSYNTSPLTPLTPIREICNWTPVGNVLCIFFFC